MIGAAALALSAAGMPAITLEQLGPIPQDCRRIVRYSEDGLEPSDVEDFADCLVGRGPDRGGDLERGVALYRLLLDRSEGATAATLVVDDLRYKIILAYGRDGDVPGMRREAEALSGFLLTDPTLRCGFFDRLAAEFEDGEKFDAARALTDRFDLADCARYVPREGWIGEASPAFFERWFGNQLLAMEERPFSEPGLLEGHTQRFRLTVLPTFTPGFSARIDKQSGGRVRLHWVILDGAGGYAPGKVADSGDRLLDAREVFLLDRALRRANLGDLPVREPPPTERIDPKTGATTITICADGTAWLFELLTENGPSFVYRSFCGHDDASLVRLIDTTYDLLPDAVPDSIVSR